MLLHNQLHHIGVPDQNRGNLEDREYNTDHHGEEPAGFLCRTKKRGHTARNRNKPENQNCRRTERLVIEFAEKAHNNKKQDHNESADDQRSRDDKNAVPENPSRKPTEFIPRFLPGKEQHKKTQNQPIAAGYIHDPRRNKVFKEIRTVEVRPEQKSERYRKYCRNAGPDPFLIVRKQKLRKENPRKGQHQDYRNEDQFVIFNHDKIQKIVNKDKQRCSKQHAQGYPVRLQQFKPSPY